MSNQMTKQEALKGAVEMLTAIRHGKSYDAITYIERLQAYELALCDLRSDDMIMRQARNEGAIR